MIEPHITDTTRAARPVPVRSPAADLRAAVLEVAAVTGVTLALAAAVSLGVLVCFGGA